MAVLAAQMVRCGMVGHADVLWRNCPRCGLLPLYIHLAASKMWCWSGGRGILSKLSLCNSIVYCYNGAQRYKQFLQVGQLDWALTLLGSALYFPSTFVSLIFMVLYMFKFFCYILYILVSCAWYDWTLTWLTNHCPSVLRCCWSRHMTRKISPKSPIWCVEWDVKPCCTYTLAHCRRESWHTAVCRVGNVMFLWQLYGGIFCSC